MPSLEVHLLTYNEEVMLPWALRHWRSLGATVYVHDAFSTDRTREIAADMGAMVWDWSTGGKFNDALAVEVKNTAWLGTEADWVVCADCDELLWWPHGFEATLAIYEKSGMAVVKPMGFEMSGDWPKKGRQIYDTVKHGCVDNTSYSKPMLFSPRRVKAIEFTAGCHSCKATLHDGRQLSYPVGSPLTHPITYLLHFHAGMGPIERVARRYDEALSRQSEANLKHGWGNRTPGLQHARDKRAMIAAGLQQVIL